MKVNSAATQALSQTSQKASPKASQRPSGETEQDKIKARVQEKFGIKIGEKKQEKAEGKDVMVSINSKGEKKVKEEAFGDIKSNNPADENTQEKLKGLLRTGGFHFNAKERAALGAILNK